MAERFAAAYVKRIRSDWRIVAILFALFELVVIGFALWMYLASISA